MLTDKWIIIYMVFGFSVLLILIVPVFTIIYCMFVPDRYFKLFRFGVLLAFFCFAYYISGTCIFNESRVSYEDSYLVRLDKPIRLFKDYNLKIPTAILAEDSRCIAVLSSESRFTLNPMDLFEEKYKMFCENHKIGWAAMAPWNLPIKKEWWLRVFYLLITDTLIITGFGLFFSLVKSEKEGFERETEKKMEGY